MKRACSQTGVRLILTAFILFVLILIVALVVVGYFSYVYFYTPQVNCRCKLGIISRIVNGRIAPKNFVPYQVSLATSGEASQHFCSGVIVNAHWILTAAHCLANLSADKIVVRVGLHELNETDLIERTYNAFRIIAHPSFKSDKNVMDVRDLGLIRLFHPIKFIHRQVEPACLNFEEEKKYDDLIVSGFGTTERSFMRDGKVTKFELSNVLKYAFYYENSYLKCRQHLICTSPRNKYDSNCHGDSGGPLSFTRSWANTTVEGIASFTIPLEAKDKLFLCAGPTGYARLTSNKEWFEEHVGANYCGNLN